MEQDRCRAQKEDIEFKAMISLTQRVAPPGKAAYHRRRISGFQYVMPTRLIFDNTVEWDDRTAQLGGKHRRLSLLQMSTVDQSDSGDGREERWSPLPTTIDRAVVDYRVNRVSLYIDGISPCSGRHQERPGSTWRCREKAQHLDRRQVGSLQRIT